MTDISPMSPTPREEAGNQVKLDEAAAICRRVSSLAHAARTLAQQRGTHHEMAEIADCARDADKGAREAIGLLVAVGAASPYAKERELASAGNAPFADPHDLGTLAELNDPETMADNEALLALLVQAQEVAERLDLRRGYVVGEHIPLQPGESRGTDLAETISEICARLRYEMHGPVGKD